MKALVIAEHDSQSLAPATLTTLSAANQLSEAISILVAGKNCNQVAEKLSQLRGVDNVLLADNACFAHPLAENISDLVIQISDEFDYFLAPATTFGKNLMPRIAAKLDVGQISDVVKVENKNTYWRPIYAGNALMQVTSLDKKQVLTIRATAFEPIGESANSAPINKCGFKGQNSLSRFVKAELHGSDRPQLSAADIVISGGRGLKDEATFKRLIAIADRLGAAIGASRAAVDSGLAPNDYQVGQTGQIVAPKLYIAVGISGAIQHLAGMKDSKVIVAINKDPDAPIFQIADYSLVAEIPEVLDQWESALTKYGY